MRINQGVAFRIIAMSTVDIILIYDDMSIWKNYLLCWDKILDLFGPLPYSGPAVILSGYLRQPMPKLLS